MSGNSPLDFVDTQELLDELLSRYDYAVFAGMKLPTLERSLSDRAWKGMHQVCSGLCHDLIFLISSDARMTEENNKNNNDSLGDE